MDIHTVHKALGPKRLAVLVGINEFKDHRWPKLKHAVNDADELGALLMDPKLGNFDHVEILDAAEGQSLADIETALDRLSDLNRSKDDLVLVYFSTHGTLAREPSGELHRYLVTSDTEQSRVRQTALSVDELVERFEKMPSSRKVLILAACTSGSGKSALPESLSKELGGSKGVFFVKPIEDVSRATMVLTASSWGEAAREDDGLGHDIYTNFLLEALSGKDQDGDGAVTASEAHAYAMERTYYFTKGLQRPQMESTVVGADPIVLSGHKIRPASPVIYSFLPRFNGMKIQVDGRDKGQLPSRLVLEPGKHRIVLTDGRDKHGTTFDELVKFSPGDRLSVEGLLEETKPRWHILAHGGYQAFFDDGVRRSLIAPAPLVGISVSRIDFPFHGFETALEMVVGGGHQNLQVGRLAVTQDLLEFAYGLQVLYRVDFSVLTLLAGPRLAGVHVLRRNLSLIDEEQNYFNFSPGLVLALRVRLWKKLSLDMEARAHFFMVYTGSESKNMGYLDLFAGLGWSL